MRSANLANEAERNFYVGGVWEEKLSGAMGTIEVPKFSTFRVRALGATTVTVGGILAMTMVSTETEFFCAGNGDPSSTKKTVSIAIAGAAAFVQVARDNQRKE
jgi:hypothetical protein